MSEHDPRANAILSKIQRNREKVEQLAEAKSKAIKKIFKKAVEDDTHREKLNQDLQNKFSGRERPDPSLVNFLNGKGDNSFHDNNYEHVTGYEDRYWETDNDED